jgi:tetratricopeptide (TPR) repeat protein
MWFGTREEEARRLEAEAHAALAAADWEAADGIAQRLLDLGWSGGFEIRALAAEARGELERARAVLEEGVAKAPASWSLWHLLGIVRSDLGQYDDALEAFEWALGADDADTVSVRFNRAIAHERRRAYDLALMDLEPILSLPRPPPFAEDALSLAAACLAQIGRVDDGRVMVQAAYDACSPEDPRRDRLAAELAIALDRAGGDPADVARLFDVAAQAGVATPSFLALGRKRAAASARAPRLHRIVVQFPAPSHMHVAGALRVFEVIADDAAQALSLARPYLPASARDEAALDEHEDCGEAPTDEVGVLWASGFVYFEHE